MPKREGEPQINTQENEDSFDRFLDNLDTIPEKILWDRWEHLKKLPFTKEWSERKVSDEEREQAKRALFLVEEELHKRDLLEEDKGSVE